MEISINEHNATNITLSYTYSRPVRYNDAHHKPNWAITGAADIPEEFYDEVAELNELTQPFKEVFDSKKSVKTVIFCTG